MCVANVVLCWECLCWSQRRLPKAPPAALYSSPTLLLGPTLREFLTCLTISHPYTSSPLKTTHHVAVGVFFGLIFYQWFLILQFCSRQVWKSGWVNSNLLLPSSGFGRDVGLQNLCWDSDQSRCQYITDCLGCEHEYSELTRVPWRFSGVERWKMWQVLKKHGGKRMNRYRSLQIRLHVFGFWKLWKIKMFHFSWGFKCSRMRRLNDVLHWTWLVPANSQLPPCLHGFSCARVSWSPSDKKSEGIFGWCGRAHAHSFTQNSQCTWHWHS